MSLAVTRGGALSAAPYFYETFLPTTDWTTDSPYRDNPGDDVRRCTRKFLLKDSCSTPSIRPYF